MNYLAHLHIAAHTRTSFSGNFLGDFVKGDPNIQFPIEIAEGIRLHRYVDSFTDKHPRVLAAKRLFPISLRRYAPIALDMFWDHCLACYWSKFYTSSLSDFCQFVELEIAQETVSDAIILPPRFQRVCSWVWQEKWLESYQKMDNISYALQRMATRSERMAPLADTAAVLIEHYETLRGVFLQLYPDILEASKSYVEKE